MEARAESRHTHLQLQQAYQQIERALDTAHRMQADLAPRALPEVPPLRLAVLHRTGQPVAAGWYDAFRLDEDHVGCHLGQVMGDGLSAGLLGLYLRQAVRTKEITGHDYRLVPPAEVLGKLNQALLRLQLPEGPFVSMVYVLCNVRSGLVSFAKAGPLAPLHIPFAGEPALWPGNGGFLGVFPDVFPAQSRLLGPGDRLVLCGDDSGAEDADTLVECAGRHQSEPLGKLVEMIGQDRLARPEPPEGLTVLGMEWGEGGAQCRQLL